MVPSSLSFQWRLGLFCPKYVGKTGKNANITKKAHHVSITKQNSNIRASRKTVCKAIAHTTTESSRREKKNESKTADDDIMPEPVYIYVDTQVEPALYCFCQKKIFFYQQTFLNFRSLFTEWVWANRISNINKIFRFIINFTLLLMTSMHTYWRSSHDECERRTEQRENWFFFSLVAPYTTLENL